MAPPDASLVLVCVYFGAIYGGSRTAILLNIPGTAANAAACLDGHALARQGRAGRAMGIATTGSVAEIADVFIRLKDGGIEPTGFSRQVPTLDDVFFKFLGEEEEDRHASAH